MLGFFTLSGKTISLNMNRSVWERGMRRSIVPENNKRRQSFLQRGSRFGQKTQSQPTDRSFSGTALSLVPNLTSREWNFLQFAHQCGRKWWERDDTQDGGGGGGRGQSIARFLFFIGLKLLWRRKMHSESNNRLTLFLAQELYLLARTPWWDRTSSIRQCYVDTICRA